MRDGFAHLYVGSVAGGAFAVVAQGKLAMPVLAIGAAKAFGANVAVVMRNAATNVQNVVTYDVIVSAPNPELTLLPGMTANVEFVVSQKTDIIKIPNAALRFKPPGLIHQ